MSKQQEFIEWVEKLISGQEEPIIPTPGASAYWDALLNADIATEKPAFTDNGKLILKQLQSMPEGLYKARDIAEALFIAPKSVSGAMRKLVNDGYVEKVGKDPIMYSITEKGKNVEFEGEN